MNTHSHRGFTLLEILLVVAAIAILAGIVIIAINPGQQLADTRDAQRHSDVLAIASALQQYQIKEGNLPTELVLSSTLVCTDKAFDSQYGVCKESAPDCTGTYLVNDLVSDYIVTIPVDPSTTNANFSGYVAFKDSNNHVHVCAPNAEGDAISITR
jgi:prepilin-type N-terminal cleavage/methylation domain-containing protein